MKKTLRILLLVALVVAMAVILTNNASAIYVDGEGNIGYDGSNVTVSNDNGVYKLQLTGDAYQDLIVRDGETVELDLNGHTFYNYTLGCEAIKIEAGGTLTIKDSVGTGKVALKDESTYALIENSGTLTIDGGTFVQKAWSAIINNGTTTINGGKFEQEETATWSLLDNKGTLTINNGTFSEGDRFYLLRNENTAIINGGEFTTTSPDTSLIGNYKVESGDTISDISLNITDGTFTAPSIVVNNYPGYDLEISGGDFTSTDAYAVNNWGNCTITGGTLTSTNKSAIRVVYENGDNKPSINVASDVTLNSAEGSDDVAIHNTSDSVNVVTGVDKDGNTVAGEVEITAEAVTCEEGNTIKLNVVVTVGGKEIVADGLKIDSSDSDIIKVNADNTLTGVSAGTTSLTATYGNVSVQVAANVTKTTTEEPEDPTTEPEEPTTDPENPEESEEPTDNEEVTNPDGEEIVQTGDYIYIAIGAVVLIVVANVIYTVKKRSRK